MKHWKCTKCHHEWDSHKLECDLCNWCGNEGVILSDIPSFALKLFELPIVKRRVVSAITKKHR